MKIYTFPLLPVVTTTWRRYVNGFAVDYWRTPVILLLPFRVLLYPFVVIYNCYAGTVGLSKSMDAIITGARRLDDKSFIEHGLTLCTLAEDETGVDFTVLKDELRARLIFLRLKGVDKASQ